jgi:hypothetical protein
MLMPSIPETCSVKKKSESSWQKAVVSSASSKDICPEAAQRNLTDQPMPPPVLSSHKIPHLLLEFELPGQMMKKQSLLPLNRKKELMM